jgi:putative ABC transport system permease protein
VARWHERVFRAILRLFPAEFRAEFGGEMSKDFGQEFADARRHRHGSMALLWLRTLSDFVRRAPAEHADVLRRDLTYAARLLVRRRWLSAITFVTLAAGIGLNTTVFSLVDAILLRPLPVPESARLVRVFDVGPPPLREQGDVSAPNFIDWRQTSRTLDGMALIGGTPVTLTGEGDAEQLLAMTVSEDFFRVLGTHPLLGRLFSHADYIPLEARYSQSNSPLSAHVIGGQVLQRVPDSGPRVVILGYDLWMRRFGGRPDVVGRVVRLDLGSAEVIGVLPQHFALTDIPEWGPADCWIPAAPDPRSRKARYLSAIGQLAPNATLARAQAEFDVIAAQLAGKYPDADKDRGVHLTSLRDAQTASVRTELWVLFGAAACVLLIAAANVTNLFLAQASGRRNELATRVALGAGRAQLVRQIVTETSLMATLGGIAGFLLAAWALPVLVSLAPAGIPRLPEVAVDWRMFGFAAIVAGAVGVACGLAIVWSLDFETPQDSGLKSTGGDAGCRGRRFRRLLSVGEIALALMLVIASGLLVRTLRALSAQDLGFDPRHVISIGIPPSNMRPGVGIDFGALNTFDSTLVERLLSSPGVIAAGVGSRPLGGGGMTDVVTSEIGEDRQVAVDIVSAGYLRALGVKLLAGRFVDQTDSASTPRVAVVNASAARLLTNAPNPVGRTFRLGSKEEAHIVGVVADTRRGTLEEPEGPAIYLSNLQPFYMRTNNMLARTTGDPRDALPIVRSILRQLDPNRALTRVTTLEERIDELLAPRRFMLRLIGLFSILAFALAMIGVYGVIAESVAQRVPEIGIRMALGAGPRTIRNLFVAQGFWIALVGVGAGLAGAFALRQGMATLVFGIPTADPLTYTAAALCLVAATVAACGIPAMRAAALDPVAALRRI